MAPMNVNVVMSGSERLQYSFGYVIDPRLWPDRDEAKAIARDIFFRTEGAGPYPKGIRLIARWRNPDNRNPRHANWKTTEDDGQNLIDFYFTLHGQRGALRAAAIQSRQDMKTVRQVRRARTVARKGKTKPQKVGKKIRRVAKRKKR